MKNNIKKSVLAGILIGFGVIINSQTKYPVLGALLFSFGLLTIINMKLNLYTGKIGYIKQISQIPYMLIILIFNCISIDLTVYFYSLANPDFIKIISTIANVKFNKAPITLFINAFFCGMLIHFAVKNKNIIITIFSIMIFILIGAEHCIADFPFLLLNFNALNIIKFICIILGNSFGALLIERLSL